SIIPQNLSINTQIQALHDAQKLLGSINWLRPLLGFPNHDLAPLFDLLKGNTDLLAP
ncbi:POK25 protein, partial [Ramphastos sulfuratus]|nr:POK25 protein [Ramphastos sulfuratus]